MWEAVPLINKGCPKTLDPSKFLSFKVFDFHVIFQKILVKQDILVEEAFAFCNSLHADRGN